MVTKKELTVLRKHLRTLIEVAIDRAEKEVDHVMPDLRTCSRRRRFDFRTGCYLTPRLGKETTCV